MRGGAWPLVGFGSLMVLMLSINWIWTGDAIQVAVFAFAAVVSYGAALVLVLSGRGEALRRGGPDATGEPEAIPAASLGAALIGLAVGTILLGLAYGRFLVYFGGGVLIASAGVVIRELRAQRRARSAWRERGQR